MAVRYTKVGKIMLKTILKYSRYVIFASILFYGVLAKVPFFQPFVLWFLQVRNKVVDTFLLNATEPTLRIMGGVVCLFAVSLSIKSIQGLKDGYFRGYTGKNAHSWLFFMLCIALGLLIAGIYAIYLS